MDQILAYGLIHLLCIPSPPGINLRLVYNIFSRYTHPISGMGGGASTSRVILISNNGVEGWAAFPGTRWTKKKREPLTFPYFLTIITNVTPQGIPFHVAAEEETLKVARRGSSLPRFQQSFCHCPSGPLFA